MKWIRDTRQFFFLFVIIIKFILMAGIFASTTFFIDSCSIMFDTNYQSICFSFCCCCCYSVKFFFLFSNKLAIFIGPRKNNSCLFVYHHHHHQRWDITGKLLLETKQKKKKENHPLLSRNKLLTFFYKVDISGLHFSFLILPNNWYNNNELIKKHNDIIA